MESARRTRLKYSLKTYLILFSFLGLALLQWSIICAVEITRKLCVGWTVTCSVAMGLACILFLLFVVSKRLRRNYLYSWVAAYAIVQLDTVSFFVLVSKTWIPDMIAFFLLSAALVAVCLFLGCHLSHSLDMTEHMAPQFVMSYLVVGISVYFLTLELYLKTWRNYGYGCFEALLTIVLCSFIMVHAQLIRGDRFVKMHSKDFLLADLFLFNEFLIIYGLTFYWQIKYAFFTPNDFFWASTSIAIERQVTDEAKDLHAPEEDVTNSLDESDMWMFSNLSAYREARRKFAIITYGLLFLWTILGLGQWLAVSFIEDAKNIFGEHFYICLLTFVLAVIIFIIFIFIEKLRFIKGLNFLVALIIVELQIVSTIIFVTISNWTNITICFAVCLILLILFVIIGVFLPRRMDLTLDIAILFIMSFIFLIVGSFVLLLQMTLDYTMPYAYIVVQVSISIMVLLFVMYHGQTINGNRFAEMRLHDHILGSLILFHDFLIIFWLTFYWQKDYMNGFSSSGGNDTGRLLDYAHGGDIEQQTVRAWIDNDEWETEYEKHTKYVRDRTHKDWSVRRRTKPIEEFPSTVMVNGWNSEDLTPVTRKDVPFTETEYETLTKNVKGRTHKDWSGWGRTKPIEEFPTTVTVNGWNPEYLTPGTRKDVPFTDRRNYPRPRPIPPTGRAPPVFGSSLWSANGAGNPQARPAGIPSTRARPKYHPNSDSTPNRGYLPGIEHSRVPDTSRPAADWFHANRPKKRSTESQDNVHRFFFTKPPEDKSRDSDNSNNFNPYYLKESPLNPSPDQSGSQNAVGQRQAYDYKRKTAKKYPYPGESIEESNNDFGNSRNTLAKDAIKNQNRGIQRYDFRDEVKPKAAKGVQEIFEVQEPLLTPDPKQQLAFDKLIYKPSRHRHLRTRKRAV